MKTGVPERLSQLSIQLLIWAQVNDVWDQALCQALWWKWSLLGLLSLSLPLPLSNTCVHFLTLKLKKKRKKWTRIGGVEDVGADKTFWALDSDMEETGERKWWFEEGRASAHVCEPIKMREIWGAWVAQWVKRPTSTQVVIL